MFEAYNKSLPLALSSVFVYSKDSVHQRAHVRELKVIMMLDLGWHECVRGKFYINFILVLINKCFLSLCRKDEVEDPGLPSSH